MTTFHRSVGAASPSENRITVHASLVHDRWNGSKLCEHEVEIYQGALVLAGECIALLLSKLSSSAPAIEQSYEQI